MCGSRYSVRQLLYALFAMPANLSPEYKKAEGGDSATPEQPAGGQIAISSRIHRNLHAKNFASAIPAAI